VPVSGFFGLFSAAVHFSGVGFNPDLFFRSAPIEAGLLQGGGVGETI